MKYNKSEIMKNSWKIFRKYNAGLGTNREGKKIINWSFADCLKIAWREAKEAIEAAKKGLCRMHYSEYKTNYADCKTVEGSYDKRTKTIEVYTLVKKGARAAVKAVVNGLCPRCHTYCYGDCCAR